MLPTGGKSGYEEAMERLSELVEGRRVWLEYDRVQDDKYGRILAWVWVDCESRPRFAGAEYMQLSGGRTREGLSENPKGCLRGRLVNEELVRSGDARVVRYSHWGELKYNKRVGKVEM